MTRPSIPTACRTAVVLAFLVALAVAGQPALLATGLGLALVAVWAAPLVLRRHHVVEVAAEAPAEAAAG